MELTDPVTALHRLGAVADGTTLRRLSDPWELRKAVREGRVVRLGRKFYALPHAQRAYAAAGRVHGVVSELSAALVWSWKVKRPPERPVLTVPRNRKVDPTRRDGIDVRYRDLPASSVAGAVTTREQTVVDCARTLPFDEALTVADSALREGGVTRADLLAGARAPGGGRLLRVPRRAVGVPSRHPPLHPARTPGMDPDPVLLGGRDAATGGGPRRPVDLVALLSRGERAARGRDCYVHA